LQGGDRLSGCRYVTNTGRATAEDAAQIFGGRSITQTGMGKLVENVCRLSRISIFVVFAKIRPLIQYHRTSPYDAILGGAEDVMGDLGVRQALRRMPKNARL
jgi:alkylation response protein AidB-like acyl-CoA dehydrogenase